MLQLKYKLMKQQYFLRAKGVLTMRLNKAIINSSLVLVLALGLGGCAANNSASTHKASHEPASAKVAKSSSHKKATNDRSSQTADQQKDSNAVTTDNQAAVNTPASYGSQPASATAAVTTASAGSVASASGNQTVTANPAAAAATPAVRPAQNTQPAATSEEEQELPAPFYYYWVWNDEQGRTHNVDWDLMDRINNNNGQITYADYYTELPGQAIQYDTRDFNLHYLGDGDQWVIDFDSQINANPNHGVVNRMN